MELIRVFFQFIWNCFDSTATMGALAMGTVLGFSSPAGPMLMSNATAGPVHLTKAQNSFFSSSMNLGALAGGPIGGMCLNKLGRRGTMLSSVVPFVGGWLLIGTRHSRLLFKEL